MSMYKTFRTDESLEKTGIYLDYSSFRVLVARAGGANRAFNKAIEAKTKPYRRAIQSDLMDREKLVDLVRQAFVETCVLGWEVKQGEGDEAKWVPGIENENGEIVPFTKAAVVDAFRKLPDLYDDIQEQAAKAALFRAELQEADAGN